MDGLKLHLGCGKIRIPGYVNVDILPGPAVDRVCDIRDLPYEDGSVDQIYSCANIEHFGRREWRGVLAHWFAKLRKGGVLYLSTADFDAAVARYAERGDMEELLGLLIGGQKDDYDWHGMIFNRATLERALLETGFSNVAPYDWRAFDVGRLGIDDYSQAYLPHMDKENGRLMMLNLRCEK